VLRLLGRRWWIIALVTVVAVAAAWMHQRSQLPSYTAQVLLEKETRASPIEALTSALPTAAAPTVIGSQVEIIQTTAVLSAVVDSLGLRFEVTEPQVPKRMIFAEVQVDSAAPALAYTVRRSGGQIVLFHGETGQELARTAPGGWLRADGLRMLTSETFPRNETVRVRLLYPEVAVARLRNALRVEQVRGTSLIRVEYSTTNPQLAASVVGSVADSYQRHAAAGAREAASRRREFLGDQLAMVADSLQALQNQQMAFQERSGTLNPEIEGEALIRAQMEAEAEVRLQRYRETVLRDLEQSIVTGEDDEDALRRAVALGPDMVPGAESLYSRLRALRSDRSRLTASRYGYTSEGAEVEVLDSLIADTRAEIRNMAREALNVAQTQRRNAEQQLEVLSSSVRELPTRSASFMRMRQEAEAIHATYDLLAGKYYEAQVGEAIEGGDVVIVDPPAVPVLPDPSYTSRVLIIALLLGLILGSGLVLAIGVMDRKIRSSEDAEAAADLNVLAMVPHVRHVNGTGRPLVSAEERTPLGEAFRTLNTMIRFSKVERPRIIAVTSPEQEAGKSTVVANLARVMATSYSSVLVVDADFPRPVQHSIFDLPRAPGLSDLLVGEAALETVIRRPAGARFDFISAGSPIPNSADLLSSARFQEMLRTVSERYEAVIFDTAPSMILADSTALAPVVDGLLLVARMDATDRRALSDAVRQLRSVGGTLLGLVINDVDEGDLYGAQSDYYSGGNGRKSSQNRLRQLLRI